jgi:hypothetical protein
VGRCGAPYTIGAVPMDLILIGGVLKYKEPPGKIRPLATTGRGLLCSQNDPQIRLRR